MSIVDTLDKIAAWAQTEICQKVKLKMPNDKQVDASYNGQYTLVEPSAFPLYVPSKDRMPPKAIVPIPSLCVQLLSGKDDLIHKSGVMKLRFCFAAWDPGLHGKDIFQKVEGQLNTYRQWNGPEAEAFYKRQSDGWRDVWNFVDTALRVLENAEYVGGFRIVKEQGIDFGPIQEEDAVPDYYPYWFAWLSFSLQYGIIRNPSYLDLL